MKFICFKIIWKTIDVNTTFFSVFLYKNGNDIYVSNKIEFNTVDLLDAGYTCDEMARIRNTKFKFRE